MSSRLAIFVALMLLTRVSISQNVNVSAGIEKQFADGLKTLNVSLEISNKTTDTISIPESHNCVRDGINISIGDIGHLAYSLDGLRMGLKMECFYCCLGDPTVRFLKLSPHKTIKLSAFLPVDCYDRGEKYRITFFIKSRVYNSSVKKEILTPSNTVVFTL